MPGPSERNAISAAMPLMGKAVLIVSEWPAITGVAESQIRPMCTALEVRPSLLGVPLLSSYRLVVADIDSMEERDTQRLARLADINGPARLLALSGRPRGEVARKLPLKSLGNVISKHVGCFDEGELIATVSGLLGKQRFEIQRLFPAGTLSANFPVSGAADKPKTLEAVGGLTSQWTVRPRVATAFVNLIDELLLTFFGALSGSDAEQDVSRGARAKLKLLWDGRRVGASLTWPDTLFGVDAFASKLVRTFWDADSWNKTPEAEMSIRSLAQCASHLVLFVDAHLGVAELNVVINSSASAKPLESHGSFNIFKG